MALHMRDDYAKHSETQGVVVTNTMQILHETLASLHDSGRNLFIIADYGSASGSNSFAVIREIASVIHKTHPNVRSILVIHEDLPGTNWQNLWNATTTGGAYKSCSLPVFVLSSGISFYNQVLPSSLGVDFAMCYTAIHWLSCLPSGLISPKAVFHYDCTPEEQALFAEQANNDLRTFARCRAMEMRPGAKLLVTVLAIGDDLVPRSGGRVASTFSRLWYSFVEAGELTAAEFSRLALPYYRRTRSQVLSVMSHAEIVSAGLRLDNVSPMMHKDCPYVSLRDAGGGGNNVSSFAQALTENNMATFQPYWLHSLPQRLTASQKQNLIERVRQGMVDAIEADPAAYSSYSEFFVVTMSKE